MQPKQEKAEGQASTLNQHKLALAIKFSIIAAAIIAFYLQDLNLVFTNALSDESTYHILAIPFLFSYLLYRKRTMVSASFTQQDQNRSFIQKNFSQLVGVLFCATAILVYWFGSYTFTPLEYHMATLPVFVAGLILILFNGQTLKQLAFPIAFLIFLTPPPSDILYSVGATLSDLSAHASNFLANLFGMASTITAQYGSPIINLTRPNGTVMNFSVNIACSGVYSLIGFGIFAVFIAYITRGKTWTKIGIFLLGIPLILALNIVRITTILGIGYSFGDQLALQVFHAIGATVLMFIGTLILLAVTEKFVKNPKPQKPCPICNQKTAAIQPTDDFCLGCGKLHKYTRIRLSRSDFAKIVSIILLITVLLSIQAPVFALTQGPAEVLIQTPSGLQPNTQNFPLPQVPGYNLSYVYRDSNFEQLSGEDASLVYVYGSSNITVPTVWVAVELASTTGPLHRWETCLINYPLSQGLQPSVTQLDLTDIQTQANPPVVGRYFAFQYHSTNQTQVILYWYETATFSVDNQTQLKQVKISLVTYPQSPDNVTYAENLLFPIAQDINNYWQPIKTWTTVALTISQNGLILSEATVALLAALLVYSVFLNRQDKYSLFTLYSKLPKQNQLLIEAVSKAQKLGDATFEEIANELSKLTNAQTDIGWLKEKLQEEQNAGLINKSLSNHNDMPYITWTNQTPNSAPTGLMGMLHRLLISLQIADSKT